VTTDRGALDSPTIVRARDAFDRALRELVEACAVVECWRLHQAAPSVAGWRRLASYKAAGTHGDAVCRDAWVGMLDAAIGTLTRAIDEEADDARRVVMASWLARLFE